ncbi:hypothetical protein IE53DRAFT_387395 [Violaceomyces palustris]|uniref:Uncharacterized protein n=1 Tax=Violaceomyces palustris TaxID=1673888 RepID=A0ACD0NX26_9BASI|nr:hypothetical protein IE53DRAFT_387395 [Violaceomyces palustris]
MVTAGSIKRRKSASASSFDHDRACHPLRSVSDELNEGDEATVPRSLPNPTRNLDGLLGPHLLAKLILFRLLNASLVHTFFQPDEYFQSQELAHSIVFGQGYRTWEWFHRDSGFPFRFPALPKWSGGDGISNSLRAISDGPIRSVFHPLVISPVYLLIKLLGLEDYPGILILAPRLQQAIFAAIGDYYTFKLANRIGGRRVAYCSLILSTTSMYSLYTSTRTFSNSLEASITSVALYHWPFVSLTEDVSVQGESGKQHPRAEKVVHRDRFRSELTISLSLAALACLLRPTNSILWIFLSLKLISGIFIARGGEGTPLAVVPRASRFTYLSLIMWIILKVALVALAICFGVDTIFNSDLERIGRDFSFEHLSPTFTPLSFFKRNVVSSLSLFYGQNPWHWYLSQGIPVICFTHLPHVLMGWYGSVRLRSFKGHRSDKEQDVRESITTLGALSQVCLWNVAVFSLLGHKEFRFLQPLISSFWIFGGLQLADALPLSTSATVNSTAEGKGKGNQGGTEGGSFGGRRSSRNERQDGFLKVFGSLPKSRKLLILLNLPPSIYLLLFHCRGQERISTLLGEMARETGGGVKSIGFLTPCHSTPWMSGIHWSQGETTTATAFTTPSSSPSNSSTCQPGHSMENASGDWGRLWFLTCHPPGSFAGGNDGKEYMDESDHFYSDPFEFISKRLPPIVDPSFPVSPPPRMMLNTPFEDGKRTGSGLEMEMDWRHTWPSHLVVFENLLSLVRSSTDVGADRGGVGVERTTMGDLLSRKGYRVKVRLWNSLFHEDPRRAGRIVLLEWDGGEGGSVSSQNPSSPLPPS